MRLKYFAAALFVPTVVSASAEYRRNPLTVESQISEVRIDGDNVIIRLYRQPFDFVAVKWLRVRTVDGQRLYARDLIAKDNIRLEGDLDHNVVYANTITLQRRDEHLGGD